MDITTNPLGAAVDVTDPALIIAVEAIADALVRDEHTLVQHLISLAKARRERDAAAARVDRPGLDIVADDVLQAAEEAVGAARDLIVERLVDDENERVTVRIVLPEMDCRKSAAALLAAADQSLTARVRQRWDAVRFPQKQDRRAG